MPDSGWLARSLWRIAASFIARAEIRGIEALYIEAMDELLAKDLSFFQDNYAGSLTKRALGYARRFEDVFDVMSFQVVANALPLAFVSVVLWRYSPLLIFTLLGMLAATFSIVFPLIRRRQRLVNIREEASNRLAGHVADSIANAETVRAFAREPEEARIHAQNVGDYGAKTLRSWDYQNLRVDTVTSPMYVLTNTLGLIVALATSRGTGASLPAVFITFSYFAAITRVMWEFNRIYRNLEGALTDAAQFAELLLDPPAVVDGPVVRAVQARRFRRGTATRELPLLAGRSRCCSTIFHCASQPGFQGWPRRPIRWGQDDADAPAAAVHGRGKREDSRGRSADRPGGANRPPLTPSATSRRIHRCSTVRSPTTSASDGREPATRTSGAPRAWHMPPNSSRRCQPVTKRSWVNAE